LNSCFLRLYLKLVNPLRSQIHFILLVIGLLCMTLWSGCSSNQNTVTANIYHNATAHYNGYFYALEKTLEVEKIVLKSLDDDPNQILRLFPKLDTTLAKSYTKDTEEIIKMASISIQRHPNSQWVDDNYIQVGLARLYSCDFQNAIQTFKYVNTKSPDPNSRHIALLHLLRTFIEQGDFERAEEVFLFLEKEKLNKSNHKNLYLGKAYFYQLRGDYDNMVRNLASADSLLSKKDRKGRIYFIVGQVYQKLGFGSEAYNYYRKCLGTNPDYEIDFYARLNMAQVARLENKGDVRVIRKQFNKLLTDTKNSEFKDKIYYEMGEFERKQGNVNEAIENYKLSAHAGKNKRIQGSSFLRAGQLYFDSLKKYSLAKAYYDSAINSLPKEFEGYSSIKKRQEVLGDFVKYTETIVWQDSLLMMAAMDSLSLRTQLDSVFASRKQAEDLAKKKKKKLESRSGGNSSNNPFFNQESTSTTDWYFGNLSAVGIGQTEFQRIWGNIPLEDNWRRSNKTATVTASTGKSEIDGTDKETEVAETKSEKPTDEAGKVFAQLPQTEKQKQEALGKIEEAYFKLGDLYYFQLEEKENASQSYQTLLTRFPESEYEPEVLYKLYLISREKDEVIAQQFAQRLKDKHPNSTFTRILLNPDYLKETSVAAEKQKLIYKEAYADYQLGNLRASQEKIKQALQVGETAFTPQLQLLQILITGKTEDISRYQYELGEFVKKYPDVTVKPYAEKLLASSKSLQEKMEKSRGIRFVIANTDPHYFVTVYKIGDKIATPVSDALEKFNDSQFKDKNLKSTNLIFTEEYAITFVIGLPNREEAMNYFDSFNSRAALLKPFSSYNFYNFVITKVNFDLFYRTKALDEYLTFFDRNYKKENQ
jgi:tetratricopeptide (TPR) repeat protein